MRKVIIPLSGEIYTNASGFNILLDFYNEAATYSNITVTIDLSELQFFDANLSAFLNALIYDLNKKFNITFETDFKVASNKFDVLFRNGCLTHPDYNKADNKKTTLPCAQFNQNEGKAFVSYITNELISHRGMPDLKPSLKARIEADLIEIFTNAHKHAKTNEPFFVAGQYYPMNKYLIFTMVDLGVGFLDPIKRFTNGEISSDIDAIIWALKGNTTKSNGLGGLGLQSIHDYCECNKGIFQIITGESFWGTDLNNTIFRGHRSLKHSYKGSILNLFFNYE